MQTECVGRKASSTLLLNMGTRRPIRLRNNSRAEPGAAADRPRESRSLRLQRLLPREPAAEFVGGHTHGFVAGGAVDKDNFMRRALWVSVLYNFGGALLFAFPSSPLGQFAGLPTPVPPIYGALLAFFVV